jgi:hypothetical protein
VTFNNRANAKAGLGQWEGALADFNFAAQMEPDYVFPRASAALTTYQLVRQQGRFAWGAESCVYRSQ